MTTSIVAVAAAPGPNPGPNSSPNSLPNPEPDTGSSPGSTSAPELRAAEQSSSLSDPTLVEMLSLADWTRFVSETLVLFAIIAALQQLLFRGSASQVALPHAFWIPVLLMSCQYGVMGGLFATTVATGLYFFGGLPTQTAVQDFYAYAGVVAAQPAEWLGTALILGGLRNLHMGHLRAVEGRLREVAATSEVLSGALAQAIAEVNALERRIAVDGATVAAFVGRLGRISLADRQALFASYAELISSGVGATSVAICLFDGADAVPVYVSEGDEARPTCDARVISQTELRAVLNENTGASTEDVGHSLNSARRHAAMVFLPSQSKPIGVVICNIHFPVHDRRVTQSRLENLCHGLAMLMVAIGATRQDSIAAA